MLNRIFRITLSCAAGTFGLGACSDDPTPPFTPPPPSTTGTTSTTGSTANATQGPLDSGMGNTSAPLLDAAMSGGDGSMTPTDAASDAGLNRETDGEADGGFDSGQPDGGEAGTDTGAQGCTGKPGLLRGKSQQTLMAGGLERTFVYYAPEDLDPSQPVPLVILPHGTSMSGEEMYEITQYAELADEEGFVAIFPDGTGDLLVPRLAPWNVGEGVCGAGSLVGGSEDDQALIDAMIELAKDDQCIDEDHIFMAGFSMGGYFSHETSCVSDKIAAIAPHSAGTHDLSECPASPKPTIIFHFNSDSLIGYECGTSARDEVVARNGCSVGSPEVVTVDDGECEYYDCPEDAQVALCTFQVPSPEDDANPAGHGWAGGGESDLNPIGATATVTNTASASQLSWEFFVEYAW